MSDRDAAEMVRSLKTFPLLGGYRGAPRCHIGAVEDVLLRVIALVQAHPEIAELDCNPLVAGPDGVTIGRCPRSGGGVRAAGAGAIGRGIVRTRFAPGCGWTGTGPAVAWAHGRHADI